MFDISFWELAIVGVVALLVIGPERLPRVARTAGLWLGRGRRFLSSVKADIDRELAADALKETLAKQAESDSLYEILEDTKQSIKQAESDSLYEILEDTKQSINPSAGSPTDPHESSKPAVAEQPAAVSDQKPNDTNG